MSRFRPRPWLSSCALFLAPLVFAATIQAVEPAAKSALANPIQAHADELFAEDAPIRKIEIALSQPDQVALFKDHRSFVKVVVTEGDRSYTDVALRLKGNEGGSFRPLHERPAMTVNFDKYKKGQLFHGHDKLYLNNSVEDESYMMEMICGELFRQAGVPCPRVAYARVVLNGRDLGLYVIKEGFNKNFLRRHFADADGNFYDGGFVTDIDEGLERSSGKGVENNADLNALVAAVAAPSTQRWERLREVLDIERFLSFMAMEIITGHWDGYSMNRNNYRIYHDPTSDKLVFFPHGMDIMFSDPDSPLEPYMDGMVSRAVLETPEGREAYRRRAAELATNVFSFSQITNRIAQLERRIQPVITTLPMAARRAHYDAVKELRVAVETRATNLAQSVHFTPLRPVTFGPDNRVTVTNWRGRDDSEEADLDRATVDGKRTLHIRAHRDADKPCSASWRAVVLLPPGHYRFEGRVQTSAVVPLTVRFGAGAGLRASIASHPRGGLSGDNRWQNERYEFEVTDEVENEEVELICELLAQEGEAWFDVASLQLLRLPQ